MYSLSLPKTCIDMDRFGNIIRIGNSRGFIIPSSILKELSLKEKDEILLSTSDGVLHIKKVEPYSGPFTGIFADMPRPEPGDWDEWEGKSTSEIMDEIRDGSGSRTIPEW